MLKPSVLMDMQVASSFCALQIIDIVSGAWQSDACSQAWLFILNIYFLQVKGSKPMLLQFADRLWLKKADV